MRVLDGGRRIREAPTTTRAEETPGNDELSADESAVSGALDSPDIVSSAQGQFQAPEGEASA